MKRFGIVLYCCSFAAMLCHPFRSFFSLKNYFWNFLKKFLILPAVD